MEGLLLAGRVLLALACVVGLVWYLARRFGASRPAADDREPRVRLIDRQALTRGSGVAVVAVGNRRLLVGFGEQQVALLTELGPVVERSGTDAPDGGEPARRTTPDTVPAAGGPLHGSVLSPQTWRDTMRALQDRTVRR